MIKLFIIVILICIVSYAGLCNLANVSTYERKTALHQLSFGIVATGAILGTALAITFMVLNVLNRFGIVTIPSPL